MRKTRKCAFCGKEFTCNSGSQRYCSEQRAEAAKAYDFFFPFVEEKTSFK